MNKASVEKAISVTPAVDLKFTWPVSTADAGDVLNVAVAPLLDSGQNYIFTLGREAAGADGITLSADTRWNYRPVALKASLNYIYASSIEFGFQLLPRYERPRKIPGFRPAHTRSMGIAIHRQSRIHSHLNPWLMRPNIR